MLAPVVVAEEHARVTRLEPDRILLARAEIVVLVEVDRQDVDREQPTAERDDPDEQDRGGGGEATGDDQPIHAVEGSAVRGRARTWSWGLYTIGLLVERYGQVV